MSPSIFQRGMRLRGSSSSIMMPDWNLKIQMLSWIFRSKVLTQAFREVSVLGITVDAVTPI